MTQPSSLMILTGELPGLQRQRWYGGHHESRIVLVVLGTADVVVLLVVDEVDAVDDGVVGVRRHEQCWHPSRSSKYVTTAPGAQMQGRKVGHTAPCDVVVVDAVVVTAGDVVDVAEESTQ